MSPANEAECRKRIKEDLIQFIEASRANMRAPVPPTVIDPARDDLRKNGISDEARIAMTSKQPCPACHGMGDYDTPHPMWGSPSCPEAYVNVKCSECDGSGVVEIELEDEA
tara:strand:- start:285 stop:617 length:333 start_codon:yes stop_codon:yes gene_type:complete